MACTLTCAPQVVNSDRLAQVNTAAGVIHPGAETFFVDTNKKTIKALYTGDTITITTASYSFIDEVSLVKWVDASKVNGCDDGEVGQSLAGHKDVRSTAHVLATLPAASCKSSTTATAIADINTAAEITTAAASALAEYNKCFSMIGKGKLACQKAGCTYTAITAAKVGFAYADITSNAMGVAADAAAPTTAWRLCMVRLGSGCVCVYVL